VAKSISVASLLSAVSAGVLILMAPYFKLLDNRPADEQVPKVMSSLFFNFSFW